MASTYRSIQYCGKHILQNTVSWPTCTRAQIITVSLYKSTQHHGQHIQVYTVSQFPANIRAHSLMTSTYESTRYHSQHVQEPTVSCSACTDCMASVWLSNNFVFNLYEAVLIQFLVTSECHASNKFNCPNITFHSMQLP